VQFPLIYSLKIDSESIQDRSLRDHRRACDNPSKEVKEFDIFDQIALSLQQIARPASENEYENYNSQKSYVSGKAGAFT
jgi:hypothetical protein